MPLHRNKFCFTGGMIEGELDFVIDPIAATLHLFFLVAVQLPGSSSKAEVYSSAYNLQPN
jgi:hypothetical protein